MTPGNELVIVDYKLSRGTQLKHDLLQLAIYAALLEKNRPGLQFHGLLEYYEPAVHTVTATPQELRALFAGMVLPVLKEIAERGALSPAPTPPGKEKRATKSTDTSDHSEAIRKCYLAFKLEVQVLGREQAPQLIRYRVKPAAGVRVVSLVNRAEDLQVALSLSQPPLIEAAAGWVTVDIPRKQPDAVIWKEVMALPSVKDHPSPVSFPIGVGVDGQVVLADFQDSNMAHMLVAGASGSGKSEFLKSMVATLISRCRPETLRLMLIDPKILTFGPLKDCRHLLQPVITDLEEALKRLEWAVGEMEKRYRQLLAEKFENIGQRAQAGKKGMPWLVLIFDEFADLILGSAGEKKHFETLVARLAAKGRAAGISSGARHAAAGPEYRDRAYQGQPPPESVPPRGQRHQFSTGDRGHGRSLPAGPGGPVVRPGPGPGAGAVSLHFRAGTDGPGGGMSGSFGKVDQIP